MITPRRRLIRAARALASEGLVSGSEGNLSLRTREGFLLSPSGRRLADLGPEDLVLVDEEGRPVGGAGRPTSEWRLHLALYRVRDDVGAVVHAHPPYTLALDLAGHDFGKVYLPEADLFLGDLALVPVLAPGSAELAAACAASAREANILLLRRHGAVALGRDLEEALNRVCILEKVSRVVWLARALTPDLAPLKP